MPKCIRCGKDTDETALCGDIDSFPYSQRYERAPYCKSCKAKDDKNATLGCLIAIVIIVLTLLILILT